LDILKRDALFLSLALAEFGHEHGLFPAANLASRGSTLYWRRTKARQQAVLADRQSAFERAEAFATALARDLERCAAIQARRCPAATRPS